MKLLIRLQAKSWTRYNYFSPQISSGYPESPETVTVSPGGQITVRRPSQLILGWLPVVRPVNKNSKENSLIVLHHYQRIWSSTRAAVFTHGYGSIIKPMPQKTTLIRFYLRMHMTVASHIQLWFGELVVHASILHTTHPQDAICSVGALWGCDRVRGE